jgi:hypothetical protein
MSHFSVLVIGRNVEEQLQPFHEFECTGTDDQYIQEIDQTEEARENWATDTTTCVRNPNGELEDRWTKDGDCRPEFYRDPTPEEEAKNGPMWGSGGGNGISWTSKDWNDGRGYRAKVYELPEGWTEVEVPTSTRQTFAEFCEDYYGHTIVPFGEQPNFVRKDANHKYGYTIVDEQGNVIKTIDRTNPNAKWDWYSVGGRWNGHFKLKPLGVGVVGEPGLQSMNEDYEHPGEDRADILMKGDIDVEGMRNEAGDKAADRWDRFHAIIAGLPEPITWKQMQEKHQTGETDEDGKPKTDWEAARTEFHAQPAVLALRNSKDRDAIWWEVDDYMVPREQFVKEARDYAIGTFAVVKDGQWYQRGKMGWWAAVSDEKDKNEWIRQFTELFDSLPDNTMLTVVDCHI